MLLIQALFILLSERGFSRKRADMFSAQLSHLMCVLKSLSVLIYLHLKPHTKMIRYKILDGWKKKKKKAVCSLQFIFLLQELSGKGLEYQSGIIGALDSR